MKIIRIILIAAIFSLFNNCKKEPVKSAIISINVDIAFKDEFGNDLLDPANQNRFSSDSIHVYTIVNGIKKEVNYPLMDSPHNFFIYKNGDLASYYLRLFLETDTTLLQLNKSIIDTVTSISEKSNGNLLLKKVWYNGFLEWDNIAVLREFTIVK